MEMELPFFHLLRAQPVWILLPSFLGFLSLLKSSMFLLKWIYNTLLRPPKNLRSYGSWALITAPTDGIGKAFAIELAKTGLHLILVGRNSEKLGIVSDEIHEKSPDTCLKTIVIDFSNDDISAGIRAIEEAVQEVDVGVLINNVGVTYPKATYFHEVDEEVFMNLIRVNVNGTTRVTRAVVPEMVKRKRGAIVNIGSGASIVVPSHPLYAVYAATKGYVDQLSRCMNVEYSSHGLHVQCQVPLYVATSMTSKVASINKASMFVPSPDAYAQAAVRWIGCGPRCMPYWTHSIQWFFAHLLPEFVLDAWRLSIGIRRRKEASEVLVESNFPYMRGNEELPPKFRCGLKIPNFHSILCCFVNTPQNAGLTFDTKNLYFN